MRTPEGTHSAVAVRDGERVLVSYLGRQWVVETKQRRVRAAAAGGGAELYAPMPGQVVEVIAREGDKVARGAKLLVIEAMKTQQTFTAPFDGLVKRLPVAKGQQVAEGALLALLEPEATGA